MNKDNYRYDRTDHISRIQANLRQMKEEVTEYLKKSNNDSVPPVLRARHYLILSCINKLNNHQNTNSRESLKILKDLSSEKLGNAVDGDKFEPLRESSSQKPEKNKIVKQKRTLIKTKDKNTIGQADCLLPNICQLKLDFEDKPIKSMPRRNIFQGKTIEINVLDDQESFLKERKYHSIDLNRESKLSDNAESQKGNGFRVTNKWLSASKSRELIETLKKKHSWSDKLNQSQTSAPKDTVIPSSNQIVDLSNMQKAKRAQIAEINSNAVYNQRKQAIIKRRVEASLNYAKNRSKNISPKQKEQTNIIKRTFHFQRRKSNPKMVKESLQKIVEAKNNQCSPWDQSDMFPERSLSALQGQIF